MSPEKERILLHTCCGPCATTCVERLVPDYEVILFFSNSNIAPEAEYLKRLEHAGKLSKILNIAIREDVYDHRAWLEHVRGLEDEPERGKRCEKCFAFSLARTAAVAGELQIPAFTTSLSVSRYKSSLTIFSLGREYQAFEAIDFKKRNGYARSIELSRQYGLYRQNYCGCEFSMKP